MDIASILHTCGKSLESLDTEKHEDFFYTAKDTLANIYAGNLVRAVSIIGSTYETLKSRLPEDKEMEEALAIVTGVVLGAMCDGTREVLFRALFNERCLKVMDDTYEAIKVSAEAFESNPVAEAINDINKAEEVLSKN